MATLGETALYLRSKNAGPFCLTIDAFFSDRASFELAAGSQNLRAERIAEQYGVPPEEVRIFRLPQLLVIKISLPRLTVQGGPEERDMHAGQQYVQLLDLPL